MLSAHSLFWMLQSTLACVNADLDEVELGSQSRSQDAAIESAAAGAQPLVLEVVRMHRAQVDSEEIQRFIEESDQTPLSLGSEDLILLQQAGVDSQLLDALRGEVRRSTRRARSTTAGRCPPLTLRSDYQRGKAAFRLSNLSTRTYTQLELTADGEYQAKEVVDLQPDEVRYIPLSSFVSREHGRKLDKHLGIETLQVKSAEGCWRENYP